MQRALERLKTWGMQPSERRVAALVTVAVVLGVHLMTIRISPPIWQDEVQIVDLGRQTLQPASPDKPWSLSWIAAGRPIAFINYLGPAMQEMAYHITAPSPSGPRVSTIAGALLAAALAYGWLRARGFSWWPAWVWSVVLLLDPQFVASYRGARVDSWVFAVMFGACLAARRGAERADASSPAAWRYFAGAGVLAGVGFFVWPSAFYLYPLLLADLVEGAISTGRRAVARRALLVATGGLVGVLLCLLPMLGQITTVWHDVFVSKDAYLNQGSLPRRILSGLAGLPLAFKLSPILPLLTLGAVFFRRNLPVTIAAAATLAVMLPTQVYAGRVVYLLPYMMILVAQGAEEMEKRSRRSWRRLRVGAVALVLLWASGLSLLARPANAWASRRARQPELIWAAADHDIGSGARKIYLGAWEFYYAGRAAGWEMFVPYGPFTPAESARFYESLDEAIVHATDPAAVTDPLVAAGFVKSREIRVGEATAFDTASLRGVGYGTYILYSRAKPR